MNVAVVNASPSAYNLGVEKIVKYHQDRGDNVCRHVEDMFNNRLDKIYISTIFTWDLPDMVRIVNNYVRDGTEIEIGGPAVTKMKDWVECKTLITPKIGMDSRFDNVQGDFEWTFTSRGCPRNCPFCLVSDLEGKKVVENPLFLSAPNIGDNNILMTSDEHQIKVIDAHMKFKKVDVNSGFDCRVFDLAHYNLWKRLPLKVWRFAYDDSGSEYAIRAVLNLLRWKGLDRHMVQVYVLCNFPGTTPAEVRYRAEVIKGFGMQPYLMSYVPVDVAHRGYLAPEWSRKELIRMVSYYNQPRIWMTCTYDEFCKESDEMPLFEMVI